MASQKEQRANLIISHARKLDIDKMHALLRTVLADYVSNVDLGTLVQDLHLDHLPNWFETLNEALKAEHLLDAWDDIHGPINYGQTVTWTWDNGTKYGHYISITRDDRGMYERPIHYNR